MGFLANAEKFHESILIMLSEMQTAPVGISANLHSNAVLMRK